MMRTCWFGGWLPAALLLVGAASSCSLAFPMGEVQCQTTEECVARGPAFLDSVCQDEICVASATEDWTCLGEANSSGCQGSTSQYTLVLHVADYYTHKTPPGLVGRLCPRPDINCDHVLGPVEIGEDGTVSAEVDGNFDGYVELAGPSIVTALLSVPRAICEDTEIKGEWPLVSTEQFTQIAGTIKAELDLVEYGNIYARTFDCAGASAAGVSLALDTSAPVTTPYYMNGGLPKRGESTSSTDAQGAGGWINVPEGYVTIAGTVVATGERIGDVVLSVRKNTVSYPWVVPAP